MAVQRKSKFDRSAMQKGLNQRHEDARANKDQGALDWESYFITPSGISLWTPKKSTSGETHYFDMIPFVVGSNYPYIKTKSGEWRQLKEGEWTYLLDIWVHRNVGSDDATVVCPKTSFKRDCPVCDHMADLLENAGDDKDKRKKIFADKAPKRRVMYNVVVRDGGSEEEKGVQIFEYSHWFMEKELAEQAEETRSHGPIFYAHPDEGKMIRFKVFDKGDNKLDVTGHTFEDRPEPISDDLLSAAIQLDSIIKVYDYDKLYEMYWGEKPEEEEEVADTGQEEETPSDEVTDDTITVGGREESLSGEGNVASNECPYANDGLTFGKDHLEYNVCDNCQNEVQCGEEKERLKVADKPAEPKQRPQRKLQRR